MEQILKHKELTSKDFKRTFKLTIFFSVLRGGVISIIWGVSLFPEGNLAFKIYLDYCFL